mgnify:CR=1 FL=1
MKTPYQEMREKSAHLIEKQRKAAEERAAKYKAELEAEQKAKQRKKNLEGIPSQAFSRANRRSASSNSDSDILIYDVLSNHEDSNYRQSMSSITYVAAYGSSDPEPSIACSSNSNSSSSNDSYSSSSSSDSSSSSCSSDSSW